eukprot:gene4087-5063_t
MSIMGAIVGGVKLGPAAITHDRVSQMLTLSLGSSGLAQGAKSLVYVEFSAVIRDDTNPASYDTGGHGIFLSPNTVPPPDSPDSPIASPDEVASSLWRLKTGQRRQATGQSLLAPWREALKAARADGSLLMIATQFEQSDARGCFPSFDEPAYKAYFEARIEVPLEGRGKRVAVPPLTVLFNTAEAEPALIDYQRGIKVFRFRRTMNPLPTYLIALAVGNFDFIQRTSRGIRYRVYTPPGYAAWAALAMNATVHAVEFFGDRYGFDYSRMNSKLDSISVGGIDMDAMENQGLCTYAPPMLLLNPNASALPPTPISSWGRYGQAHLITLVTSHEILHMWFGDTVTMRDWDQEYLNEGFARAMQYYAADDLIPEWDFYSRTGRSTATTNSWLRFTYEVAQGLDSTGTAPAIVYPLPGGGDQPPFPKQQLKMEEGLMQDPSKAPLFSKIFYEKGAAVNRMVATHVGWDHWDEALGAHLNAHQWQNPTVEDLMRSLAPAFASVGSPPAMESMLPWLRQPGYPVITLSLESTATATLLHASQLPISRYLPSASEPSIWWIPLRVSVAGSKSFVFEFNSSRAVMDISNKFSAPPDSHTGEHKAAASLIVGDPAFWGMFIVRYKQSAQWESRITGVASSLETKPDYARALCKQIFLLVTMSHEPVSLLTKMIESLAQKLGANPVIGGYKGTGDFYTMILEQAEKLIVMLSYVDNAASGDFVTAMRSLVGPLAERLGFESTDTPPPTAVSSSASSVPWPEKEDAGVELRGRTALRPVALLNAVAYGNPATVKAALVRFRARVAGGGVKSSTDQSSERAVYLAGMRYGLQNDTVALQKLVFSTSPANPDFNNMLFGLLAGATSENLGCGIGLDAIHSTILNDKAAIVKAFSIMLQYAPPSCRARVWEPLSTTALKLWAEIGADATKTITEALSLLTTVDGLANATSLLATQNASVMPAGTAHSILTQVKINIDIVATNGGSNNFN